MAKARVQFVGFHDEYVITPEQLKPHGIEIDNKLVWNRYNGFSQVVDLNDDLERVLREQGNLTIHALKDDGKDAEAVVTASDPNRVENVVANEEGKSVQKSSAK